MPVEIMTRVDLDTLCVNAIRTLSIDAIQRANSGHPGTPMGMAPTVYALWQRQLRFDPQYPIWPNRDRFVLSSGHASTLLYSIRHLTKVQAVDPGYEIPGGRWTGVETTTGPLGQGVATSVGMAMAAKWLGARYNRPGFDVFDYNIYSVCGDGCLMQGVSSEAASLAGQLKLDNLCWIYDSNRITIEGSTQLAFTEDVAGRFMAYGWNVTRVVDATDLDLIENALKTFQETTGRPTLIIVDSHTGYGPPHKQDTSYEWPEDKPFFVPDGVYEHFEQGIGKRGRRQRMAWEAMFAQYEKQYSDLAQEIHTIQNRDLPAGWEKALPVFPADEKGVAGRDASAKVENAIAQQIPWLIGGSADLSPSTASMLNGMAISKLRPFGSSFLIFSDYARGAIRLSALMEIPVVHIFTYDSIGVGEDGPTHQPVEQLISLRAIPNLIVLRPADANEVVECWRVIMNLKRQPAALVLSRQALPTLDRTRYAPACAVARGAYILADGDSGAPEVILMATGSEVSLCVTAFERLASEGIKARVVSMPSWELFEQQSQEYRDTVLPPSIKARVAVEQASTLGWAHYTRGTGTILGMKTFGASTPLKVLQGEFGFTVENVVAAARAQRAWWR